jgi:hypothetical protein
MPLLNPEDKHSLGHKLTETLNRSVRKFIDVEHHHSVGGQSTKQKKDKERKADMKTKTGDRRGLKDTLFLQPILPRKKIPHMNKAMIEKIPKRILDEMVMETHIQVNQGKRDKM